MAQESRSLKPIATQPCLQCSSRDSETVVNALPMRAAVTFALLQQQTSNVAKRSHQVDGGEEVAPQWREVAPLGTTGERTHQPNPASLLLLRAQLSAMNLRPRGLADF